MRFVVVLNCGAGSVDEAEEAAQVAAIEGALGAAGATAEVHVVEPDRLGATALRLWNDEQPRAVVAAGGDGTIGAVAAALAGTGAVMGVLPLGTFNHFAQDLGVPADLAGAASVLTSGEVRAVDVAEVNGHVFVNNSVLGAYPTMVAFRDELRETRGWGKVRAVPVAAAKVLRAMPVHRLTLTAAPHFERRKVRTPMLFVGNNVYDNAEGGLGGRAAMDGGVLGVAVARVVSRWGLLRLAVGTLVRGAARARELDQLAVDALVVSTRSSRLRVALDGELRWLNPPLAYETRPAALQVLAPPSES